MALSENSRKEKTPSNLYLSDFFIDRSVICDYGGLLWADGLNDQETYINLIDIIEGRTGS